MPLFDRQPKERTRLFRGPRHNVVIDAPLLGRRIVVPVFPPWRVVAWNVDASRELKLKNYRWEARYGRRRARRGVRTYEFEGFYRQTITHDPCAPFGVSYGRLLYAGTSMREILRLDRARARRARGGRS